MNNEQFLAFFYDNLQTNLLIASTCLLVYVLIFVRAVRSAADPLALGVLAQAMAASVVFMLRAGGELSDFFFHSFLATEAAFIAGCFVLGAPRLHAAGDMKNRRNFDAISRVAMIVFWLSSAIFVSEAGFLLFASESRLIVMQRLGMVTWFVDVCWVAVPIIVMMRGAADGKISWHDRLAVLACILLLITKGGKTDFVLLIFSAYLVAFVFQNRKGLLVSNVLMIVAPVLILAVTGVTLIVWDNDSNPLLLLMHRLLMFGDAFFQGYNGYFLYHIRDVSPLTYLAGTVSDFFSYLLGERPEERLVLGYEMSNYYYKVSEGMGPNARVNILGLYLFGQYGAIVFAFIVGATVSVIRRGIRPTTYTKCLLYLTLNIFALYFFIDPSLAIGYLMKLAVVSIVVVTLAMGTSFFHKMVKPNFRSRLNG